MLKTQLYFKPAINWLGLIIPNILGSIISAIGKVVVHEHVGPNGRYTLVWSHYPDIGWTPHYIADDSENPQAVDETLETVDVVNPPSMMQYPTYDLKTPIRYRTRPSL